MPSPPEINTTRQLSILVRDGNLAGLNAPFFTKKEWIKIRQLIDILDPPEEIEIEREYGSALETCLEIKQVEEEQRVERFEKAQWARAPISQEIRNFIVAQRSLGVELEVISRIVKEKFDRPIDEKHLYAILKQEKVKAEKAKALVEKPILSSDISQIDAVLKTHFQKVDGRGHTTPKQGKAAKIPEEINEFIVQCRKEGEGEKETIGRIEEKFGRRVSAKHYYRIIERSRLTGLYYEKKNKNTPPKSSDNNPGLQKALSEVRNGTNQHKCNLVGMNGSIYREVCVERRKVLNTRPEYEQQICKSCVEHLQ
jgi:transposase